MKRAKVEIWRHRNGTATKVLDYWTNNSGQFGAYTHMSSAWLPSDTFVMRVLLERKDESWPPSTAWRWCVCAPSPYVVWGDSGQVSPDANGNVHFGTWWLLGDAARIYATLQDSWDVFSSSSQLSAVLYNLTVDYRELSGCIPSSGSPYTIDLCHEPGTTGTANNKTVAHEIGHTYHRHAWSPGFEVPIGFYGWPSMQDIPAWHGWDSAEWEEAAMVEGWADFAAAVAFYTPAAAAPKSVGGHSISDPAMGPGQVNCVRCYSYPAGAPPIARPSYRCEANEARFFWDIYDTVNDDAYNDGRAMSIQDIMEVFWAFPQGNANRQRSEHAPNGDALDDGPNAWDYYWNALYGAVTTQRSVVNEIWSNCLNHGAWD